MQVLVTLESNKNHAKYGTFAIISLIWSIWPETVGCSVGGKHWRSVISIMNSLQNRALKAKGSSWFSLALLIICMWIKSILVCHTCELQKIKTNKITAGSMYISYENKASLPATYCILISLGAALVFCWDHGMID